MKVAPPVAHESVRIEVLRDYAVVDTPPEPALDDLTALAAYITDTPISLISLVDEHRQWFKSKVGLAIAETSRDVSFCAHTIADAELLVVEDAQRDERFFDNPLVAGEPAIRFYAGAPLLTPGGHALGTLCVIDRVPRQLTESQLQALRVLSRQAMSHLELRRQSRHLAERERWLRAIFEAEPECVKLLRRDGSLLDMNAAGLQMIEADSLQQVKNHHLYPLVAEEHRPAFKALTARVFTGESGRLEFQIVGLKGGRLWLETHATPLRDASGEVVALLGITRNITDRKAAEDALRKSQTSLIKAQAIAKLGSWERNLVTGAGDWSDEMYRLVGRTPSLEPPSRDEFLALVHPEDRVQMREVVDQAISRQVPYHSEFRIVRPDGVVRWVEARGDVGAVAGRTVTLAGTTQDVTERRQAEERIRHLNRVYALMSDINEMIVREKDPQTLLSQACHMAVATGGFCMATIALLDSTSRLVIRAHAGADADGLQMLRTFLNAEPPAGCPFTRRALNEGTHAVCNDVTRDPLAAPWREAAMERNFFAMAALPLKVGSTVTGSFNLYASEVDFFTEEELRLLDELAVDIAFAMEMHEREAARASAELQRRQAEERLRQVVENIEEVFWVCDPSDHRTVYVSPAYETIWGRPCASLYATPEAWRDAIHPADAAAVAEALVVRLARGDYNEVYRIVRPDGSHRWVRDRAFPIRDADGRVSAIVGTATDITEHSLLEEQLRQSTKMESVGRLAGGIAHDFNNLLTIISGLADLILLSLGDQDPLREDVEQIRVAGERAAALTRQLLALSRQQILELAVIDLRAVVGNLESMLQRLIGEDIAIVVSQPEALGSVKADPRQIEQVILNLSINARDAMLSGGTLTIALEDVDVPADQLDARLPLEPGRYVMVAVSDTGRGMDERTRDRVFEPFFTTKEVGKGTGLGLSTAYGIVRQSGGSIQVESSLGQGTVFRVYLPRVEELPEQRPSAPANGAISGSETILLVEDEPALRALTRRILQSGGYTVLEASGGGEALEMIDAYKGPLHLMLTDVVLPGMNGRELAERLTAQQPQVKVLYTSGYTDDSILRHGVLEDPSRFMRKPYTPAILRQRVREALDS